MTCFNCRDNGYEFPCYMCGRTRAIEEKRRELESEIARLEAKLGELTGPDFPTGPKGLAEISTLEEERDGYSAAMMVEEREKLRLLKAIEEALEVCSEAGPWRILNKALKGYPR